MKCYCHFRKALDHKNESYESLLEKSIGFNNPNNIHFLSELMAISGHCSLMKGLRGKFPDNEYASELRQVQASKWAYRNVADGIDHFKAGKHIEAFQCLNKALNIDPKNVEGLVARGALYANSGNFQKAIEDFETALKLNPNHANARKYMGETLVALGRSYEEENKMEDAKKAYQSCLSIIPYHEEAKNSLEFLKNKTQGPKNLIEPEELLLPSIGVNTSISKPTDVNDALKQLLKSEEEDKKDKKKKKKSKKRKSHKHSSSSSSSSSSGSGDSSSSSSSSSSDSSSSSGDSDFKKRKKHRSRSHRREKQSSLSPLSKRMAMMDQTQDTTSNYTFNKPAQSYDFGFEQNTEPSKVSVGGGMGDLDEDRIRAFLKETADDSDYEGKVRKFLEESAKWKKGKGDDKKKKKKKDKKSKKESKKKKKEKKMKRKAAAAAAAAAASFDLNELDDNKKLRDAIKKELSKEKRSKKHHEDEDEYLLQKSGYTKRFIDSLPDLEELESKLNAYYAREKESRHDFSESPKRSLMESPSPTREQKARQAVAEAAASAGKWKMQMAPGPSGNSRFKKKQMERMSQSSDIWDEKPHFSSGNMGGRNDNYDDKRAPPLPPPDKGVSVRKQMAMKEMPPLPPQKKPESPKKSKLPPEPPKPNVNTGQVVLDKFGNFRLMTPPELKKGGPVGGAGGSMSHENVPLPPGAPPRGINAGRRPPEPPGRPRSNSRSPRRRTRSRSKFSRSRSSSMSRSRSRSYRSRSRTYYSRSRSRSGSYYSRSRSRSRSYSGDRRRYRRGGGGFRGGRYNDRGTYYKPRFQNPRHNNQRPRGGGNYNNRDSRYDNRDYRGGRRGPFQNRGGRRQRGRFQRGGYRDFRDRRFDRSRSRDRSRSFSGSRDSGEDGRRNHDKDKDKINKYADNTEVDQQIRHEGPLSEGEDRDDYTNNDKMVNREAYDGKWAEKDKERSNGDKDGGNEENSVKNSIPSETNIEEMDKFLDKVKKDKKKEMMERNKDLLENKSLDNLPDI